MAVRYHVNERGQGALCKITFTNPKDEDTGSNAAAISLTCPSALGFGITFGSKEDAEEYYSQHKSEFRSIDIGRSEPLSKGQVFREIGNKATRDIRLHDYIIAGYINSNGVEVNEAYRFESGFVVSRDNDSLEYRIIRPTGEEHTEPLPFDGYLDLTVVHTEVSRLQKNLN